MVNDDHQQFRFYVVKVRIPGEPPYYRAVCNCGWTSNLSRSKRAAAGAGRIHQSTGDESQIRSALRILRQAGL